jgi:hypothetical protein
MSRGIPSLNTSPKSEPAGAPFNPNAAENGLSVDAVSGKIVLGNDSGDPLQPAQLLSDREIQLNGFGLVFPDAFSNTVFRLFSGGWRGFGNDFCFMGVGNGITFQGTELFSDGLTGRSGLENTHGRFIWFAASGGCVLDANTGAADPGTNVFLITYGQVLIRGRLCNDRFVSAQAASPVAVSATDDKNKVFTNQGATGAVTFNLPSATAGLSFTFIVQDADGIVINAAAGDTIRIGTLVTAPGGSVTSTVIGSSVTLVAINTTEWVAIAALGTWI